MAIFCQLFKFNLRVVYFILKLFPIKKNKIVFISRQSNNPSFDFLMLKNELLKINSSFEIVIITKKIEKGLKIISLIILTYINRCIIYLLQKFVL